MKIIRLVALVLAIDMSYSGNVVQTVDVEEVLKSKVSKEISNSLNKEYASIDAKIKKLHEGYKSKVSKDGKSVDQKAQKDFMSNYSLHRAEKLTQTYKHAIMYGNLINSVIEKAHNQSRKKVKDKLILFAVAEVPAGLPGISTSKLDFIPVTSMYSGNKHIFLDVSKHVKSEIDSMMDAGKINVTSEDMRSIIKEYGSLGAR